MGVGLELRLGLGLGSGLGFVRARGSHTGESSGATLAAMKAARSISQDASGVLWLSAGSLSEVMVEVEELEAGRAACCCISVSLKGLGSQPPPVVSRHAVRTVQYTRGRGWYACARG